MTGTEIPPAYEGLLAEARAVAAQVEPYAAEADESSTLDPRAHQALRTSGLAALTVPAAFGGRYEEVDPIALCVVREVFMAASAHLDSVFALQGIGSFAISRAGSDDQRRTWLPRVANAEALAALALTEPTAGSDLKAIRTTLRPDGDALVLSGQKAAISNAGAAAFYVVLAREDDGLSLALVPADTVGVTVEAMPPLIAPHVLGDVRFDGVRLPATARIGAAGEGLSHVLATLGVFRASVAAASVGLARAALEEAVRHAAGRVQFGRPLARLGPVAGMLADSWAEVEAARLLTYRAAERARVDPLGSLHDSSMAKLFATEAATRVVDRSVQVMGRFGLVRGSKIERLYRQARPMRIYEGSSEVLRLGIAKALVDEVTGA